MKNFTHKYRRKLNKESNRLCDSDGGFVTLIIIAIAVALLAFILMIVGIVAIVRHSKDSAAREAMAPVPEEMQILSELKAEMKNKELTIILDAGHGGTDVGAGDETYWEKDLNMDIVQKMYDMFTYCGVNVLLTRDGDETVALKERSSFANEHDEAAYFISVHCNVCEGDASVSGLECYYWEGSEEGERYAQAIADGAASDGKIEVHGIKTDNFHVLRETRMPAVLIETGYLSNEGDKKKLYDDAYQKTLSVYLVKGIIEGAFPADEKEP